MLRRVVASLLMPLLLLAGMCSAHSHAGEELVPHVHLHFFYSLWQQPESDKTSDDPRFGTPEPEHDDDAIYLSISILHGWRSECVQQVDSDQTKSLDALGEMLGVTITGGLVPLQRTLPHIVYYTSCPIYLRSLALLI